MSQPSAPRLPWLAVAAAAAFVGLAATVAADSRWLVALGRVIVDRGGIPDGIPFASAPSAGWPNVPVLAELVLDAAHAVGGERGLLALQLAAVVAAFGLLLRDARAEGAGDRATFIVLLVLVPALLGPLVTVRLQLFSLVLFPLLALLLRAEARTPSRRIWLVVPLIALWSNLHGGVLTGTAVLGAYLLFERLRHEPRVALGVLAASLAAICVTPALLDTVDYYHGVLRSAPATLRSGLWAAPDPTMVVDALMLAGAVVLVLAALRSRARVWELVALAGLAVLTARAARGGVFLVPFAAVMAARALPLPGISRPRLGAPVVLALSLAALAGLAKGPLLTGAGDPLLRRTLAVAAGTPVLAGGQLAEQVALRGGRIWMGNPVDAFPIADQRLWVHWLDGDPEGDAAVAHAPRAILVERDSDAEQRLRRRRDVRRLARDAHAALYVRR